MALVVKMDGNSRLAKQFRFADKAQELADRLMQGERPVFVRNAVVNCVGQTDALGRVLRELGSRPTPGTESGLEALAGYLGVTPPRLPKNVFRSLFSLTEVNDKEGNSNTRRLAIAVCLTELAGAVRNARIGAQPVNYC